MEIDPSLLPPDPLVAHVEGVAAGREDSLRELYSALEGRVYGLALRILGDPAAAEEATVETFGRVWERAQSFDASRGRVAGWVCMMTRSHCLDMIRAGQRAPATVELAEATEVASDSASPEQALVFGEWSERVRDALRTLPQEMQGALRAAFFEGLTYREVADQLQQPLGTIKTRIRSALVRLRAVLAQGEEELA